MHVYTVHDLLKHYNFVILKINVQKQGWWYMCSVAISTDTIQLLSKTHYIMYIHAVITIDSNRIVIL